MRKRLRLLISDYLLSWSFDWIPSDHPDKEKMAHLLMNRFDGRKYGVVVTDGQIDEVFEEVLEMNRHAFRDAVRASIKKGSVQRLKKHL